MTIKSKLRLIVDELETKDKVDLLKELYHDIAGMGIEGDTELAHINPLEAALLRSFGGAGTINIQTGLPQYKGGGGSSPSAVYQNTMQTSRLAPEIAPYATDVLTEAQDLYRMVMNQGYDPYTGAITAPQTAEQIAALSGTTDLVGTGRPLMEEGLNIQREQLEKFTPEVAQEYMSPYQQAVTEVEKRKAVEDFQQRVMPEFEKQGVFAGGMSGMGSRAGVQAALLGQGLGTQLGDIEAKGLQKAYQDAQKMFGQQKGREAAAAKQIAAAGPAMFAQGLQEMGALGTVGEQKQKLAQKGLDEQYYKWLEQKAFPEEALAKYSGFVYGNPLMSQRDVQTTYSAPAAQGPSFGQQLLAGAGQAANIYRQAGSPSFGNLFAAGGGGLSDLIYRQESGRVYDSYPSPLFERDADGKSTYRKIQERNQRRPGESRREQAERLNRYYSRGTTDKDTMIDSVVKGIWGWLPDKEEFPEISKKIRQMREQRDIVDEGVDIQGTLPLEDVEDLFKIDTQDSKDVPVKPDQKGLSSIAIAEQGPLPLADTTQISEVSLKEEAITDTPQEQLKRVHENIETAFDAVDKLNKESRDAFVEGAKGKRAKITSEGYDRVRSSMAEPDFWGNMINAVSRSLLRARSGDPRDPESTVNTWGEKILEGMLEGSEITNKERKKLQKQITELGMKRWEQETKNMENDLILEAGSLNQVEKSRLQKALRKGKNLLQVYELPYKLRKLALESLKAKAQIGKISSETFEKTINALNKKFNIPKYGGDEWNVYRGNLIESMKYQGQNNSTMANKLAQDKGYENFSDLMDRMPKEIKDTYTRRYIHEKYDGDKTEVEIFAIIFNDILRNAPKKDTRSWAEHLYKSKKGW